MVVRTGEVSESKFHRAVNAVKPPAPSVLVLIDSKKSPHWEHLKRCISSARAHTHALNPEAVVRGLDDIERMKAKPAIADLVAWLSRFEQALAAAKRRVA
jgi:hypothetical protein